MNLEKGIPDTERWYRIEVQVTKSLPSFLPNESYGHVQYRISYSHLHITNNYYRNTYL